MLSDSITEVYGGPKGRAMRQYPSDIIYATIDGFYATVDDIYGTIDDNYATIDYDYEIIMMR